MDDFSFPRQVIDVIKDATERMIGGDLADYEPIPTGFAELDRHIGGGIRKSDLVLLGGAQGIGKTIASLQVARNIAALPNHMVVFVCYEHTEVHLLHRLLCLESLCPPEIDTTKGLGLKDIYAAFRSRGGAGSLAPGGSGSFRDFMQGDLKMEAALERITAYGDRLLLLKGSPLVTSLKYLTKVIDKLAKTFRDRRIVLVVDYLQKIAVKPDFDPRDEQEKITIVVEGLKGIALNSGVSVWAIVAADREGLRSRRIHLYHLRGSYALDYEADIAILMNNKYTMAAKDAVSFNPYTARDWREWVVFTLEKNRAGSAFIDLEFQLHGKYFAFDPRGRVVSESDRLLINDKILEY